MATIRDIAAFSGVSIATVSRALNTPEQVSPETLAQVLATANQLQYSKPRPKKRMTNLFGVILPDLSNPFFNELLEVLEQESYLHGRSILFFHSKKNARQEMIALHECEAHGVDGVFLVPVAVPTLAYQEKLQAFKFKTVILTRSATLLPSVAVDHVRGGEMMSAHLLSQGHANIAYLGTIQSHDDKYRGFSGYLEQQAQPLRIQDQFDYYTQTYPLNDFLYDILVRNQQITAIGCDNDIIARRVIDFIHSVNGFDPNRLTVVGFDNSLIAKLLNFSSIAQPMAEIAHLGFKAMLNQLQATINESPVAQLLLPRLIIRS